MPKEFLAAIVNVYFAPLVRPVRTCVEACVAANVTGVPGTPSLTGDDVAGDVGRRRTRRGRGLPRDDRLAVAGDRGRGGRGGRESSDRERDDLVVVAGGVGGTQGEGEGPCGSGVPDTIPVPAATLNQRRVAEQRPRRGGRPGGRRLVRPDLLDRPRGDRRRRDARRGRVSRRRQHLTWGVVPLSATHRNRRCWSSRRSARRTTHRRRGPDDACGVMVRMDFVTGSAA